MYLQGRPPPSVNMYWRRFAIADIPLHDHDAFDLWLRERWYEKDALIEHFLTTGYFPASTSSTSSDPSDISEDGHIETEVRLSHWSEVGNIFVVLAAFGLVANLGVKLWNLILRGKQE
jgi:lysocardiolipin and lysophospholipid acyltransferase